MNVPIDEMIRKMGYPNSLNFLFFDDIKEEIGLSIYNLKILREIKPYAVYLVDKKPFILFFELSQPDDVQRITKQI
jgi:hypothetical protein